MKKENYQRFKNAKIAIIGANGGIGSAIINKIYNLDVANEVIEIVRTKKHSNQFEMDMLDDNSIFSCAEEIQKKYNNLDIIINATGLLHVGNYKPERTFREINYDYLNEIFKINTFSPFLISKYFSPLLNKNHTSIIAFLSARLGSISDNSLGGWYSYRSSKAALNMLIKTLSLELAYTNKNAICIGIHPGTVDTKLSSPFTEKMRNKKIFTKDEAAGYLMNIINNVDSLQNGYIIDWQEKKIDY
jgi:NAD(P)-dependent dehydrogenase (short-subunit alcohol dehydrogenase family)